jgi:CRP-like cAMP-binding protein
MLGLNLTHKALGDIYGLTRVIVTKIISLFRHRGILRDVGDGDLLITTNPFIHSP